MEDFLKKELLRFVTENNSDEFEECVDDIVLTYLLSNLEELAEGTNDDGFDMEGFVEMMAAYVPGFEDIKSSLIYDWMFKLVDSLRDFKSEGNRSCIGMKGEDFNKNINDFISKRECSKKNGKKKLAECDHSLSNVPKDLQQDRDMEEMSTGVTFLSEMFPDITQLELERFLFLSKGDVEHATQIILAKEAYADDEIGENYEYGTAKPAAVQEHIPSATKTELTVSEMDKVKAKIVQRYSFEMVGSEEKPRNSALRNMDCKKATRYFNSKVVNTKVKGTQK